MLRRLGPRLLILKRSNSPLRLPIPGAALHTAVQYSDPGFFTPKDQPSSSSYSSSPSSSSPNEPRRSKGRYERVSDQEYSVRIGRASDLLRATLPDFMRTGLVDYQHDQTSRSSGLTLLDVFTFRALMARGNGAEEEEGVNASDDHVYDFGIQFQFRPAPPSATSSSAASPNDEEAASLSFSGRSLYFASAHVLRHTLNVFFSDAKVEVRKLRLESKGDQLRVEDVLHLRMEFAGHARVTGQEHNYTLIFRYDFDSDTGRIIRHTVEKVEPAIGKNLWTGIATVWQRLIGHEPTPVPTACHIRTDNSQSVQSTREAGSSVIWNADASSSGRTR